MYNTLKVILTYLVVTIIIQILLWYLFLFVCNKCNATDFVFFAMFHFRIALTIITFSSSIAYFYYVVTPIDDDLTKGLMLLVSILFLVFTFSLKFLDIISVVETYIDK
jgi:hypothetical protein